MSIKVRYFASLRETVGRNTDELQVSGATSARQVWQQLNPDLKLPENLLVAVNMEYITLDSEVNPGDELAFFPPVTGG